MKEKSIKIIKKIVAIVIMSSIIFYGSGYNLQAKGIGGSVTVTIESLKFVFDVNYVDNEGNQIGDGYTTDQIKYERTEAKEFALDAKEIEGYDYAGYYCVIEASGRKIDLNMEQEPIINIENITNEDVVSGVCTYKVYMMYTKSEPKETGDIAYTFNVKYIDTNTHEISDAYLDTKEGVNSTFSMKITDITGYEYKGYYYDHETGERGINTKGNLNNLLTNDEVTITTDSEGKDAENGKGIYTIYAVYSQIGSVSLNYSVTYDANGGEGSVVDTNIYAENDTVTVLGGDGLSRTEYIFSGWNTAADGSGTSYNAGNTFTITENTKLYAQWNKSNYSVTYDANGGEGSVTDSNAYAKNDPVTVSGGTRLSRKGYTFDGWNTAADGSGTSYAAGSTFTITENITLYAQWIEKVDKSKSTSDGNASKAPGRGNTTPKSSSAKTGDNSFPGVYLLVMFLAVMLIFLVLYWRKKAQKRFR